MIRQIPKGDISEICIQHWQLIEEETERYFYLEVPSICQIYSDVSAEECRRLLRAIIHTWMNMELAKSGIPLQDIELWQRERKLLVKYVAKAAWEWSWSLQKPANLYQLHEARNHHNAILCIMGNIWRFESKLKLGSY